MHEANQPDLVGDLSDAHRLTAEHGADVNFASAKAGAAAASHPCGSVMIRLFIFLLTYSILLFFLMALLFPEGVPSDHDYRAQFMRNRVWFFGVFLLFLCLDLLDYWIKLEKDVSIANNLQYAAFVGPLILLSLIALRTANLLFHRVFSAYALLAVLAMSVNTLLLLTS